MKPKIIFYKGLKWLCLVACIFYLCLVIFGLIFLHAGVCPFPKDTISQIKTFGLLAFTFFVGSMGWSFLAGESYELKGKINES